MTRTRAVTAWRAQGACWAVGRGRGWAGWLVMSTTLRGVRQAGQRGGTHLGRGLSLQTVGPPRGTLRMCAVAPYAPPPSLPCSGC